MIETHGSTTRKPGSTIMLDFSLAYTVFRASFKIQKGNASFQAADVT